MENKSGSLVVKLSYDGTLRRITVPSAAELSFVALEAKARDVFGLANTMTVKLAYTDMDGDVVTMVDDADLKDAIVSQKLNPLRVSVNVKESISSGVRETAAFFGPTVYHPNGSSNHGTVDRTLKDTLKNAVKEKAKESKSATTPLGVVGDIPVEAAKSAGETSATLKEEAKESPFPKEESPKVEESLAPKESPMKEENSKAEARKPEVTPAEELRKIQSEVKERLEASLRSAAGDVEGLMASFAPFLQVAPAKLAEVIHLAMKSGLHASFEPQFDGPATPGAQAAPASPAAPAAPATAAAPAAEATATENEASPKAPAQKEEAGNTGLTAFIHTGVQCDVCGVNPIVGPRYKSVVRNNYDLCKTCYAKDGVEGDYNKIERPLFRPRGMHPFWGHGNASGRMGMYNAPGISGGGGSQGPCFGGRPFYQGRTGGCARFAATQCAEGKLDARFVKDVTIFDGTELAPATPFTKIWRLRNSGTVPWPRFTQLVFVGGDQLGSSQAVTLQIPAFGLGPGEEVDVSVDLVAPEKAGRYVSHWRLMTPAGPKFGHRVWALVQVVPADEPSPQVAESVASSSGTSSTEVVHAPCDQLKEQQNITPEAHQEPVKEVPIKEVPIKSVDESSSALGVDESPSALDVQPEAQPKPEAIVEQPASLEPTVVPAPDSPKTEETSVGGFSLIDSVTPAASESNAEEQQTSFVLSEPSAPQGDASESPAQQGSPAIAGESNADTMEQMLTQLEAMGFTDRQLNQELLKANDMHLQHTLDELVSANEWDPIMVELEEMGFYDKDVNRRLMFKNKGSVKRVVKELVENLKRPEQ